MPEICSECGSKHYGPCATEETCFVWEAGSKEVPSDVVIKGSWKKWQSDDHLSREFRENGEVFFRICMTLHPGTYNYKYLVDGQWECNPNEPMVLDEEGNCNNYVKVFPKKMYLPMNKKGEVEITSNLLIEGLKLVGSWDGWARETPMIRIRNNLANRQELIAYVPVEANREYEFNFKLKKQYLIDDKYPTTANPFEGLNNIIIAENHRSEDFQEYEEGSAKKERTATPGNHVSASYKAIRKDFSCKSFEWVTVPRDFDLPYKRVEGLSMSAIGDYLYIFGGFCRSEYYNSLTKLSLPLATAKTEEALPEGRAFHNMVTYGNKIIIYGGHNSSILQNYYSFNVSEEKWVAIPHISGKYPDTVEKQSCVLYETFMVFFGGYFCSPDVEYEACYKAISVLDIETMRWVDQIKVDGDEPTGRFAHAAALVDEEMFIFGGIYNAQENLCLNDIWKLNLSKRNDELSWVQLKPKGKRPCPRHGHTMNTLHNYLVVFGGHSEKGDYLNDVFIFNTADNQWFQPMISGTVPRGRYSHAAATVSQTDEIVVFGGRTNNNRTQHIYILRPNEKVVGLDINEEDNEEE